MRKISEMRNCDRRKLDDLQERESKIEIDCGNQLCRGTYHGLVRMKIGGCVKWYVDVRDARRKFETLVETCDIESLRVLRKRKAS